MTSYSYNNERLYFLISQGDQISARIFRGSGRESDEAWQWSRLNSGVLVELCEQ